MAESSASDPAVREEKRLRHQCIVHGVPMHIRDALLRYVLYGLQPGSFLSAYLRNDLREAFVHADSQNAHNFHPIAKFLWNEAPTNCWGSEANFKNWRGMFPVNPASTEPV